MDEAAAKVLEEVRRLGRATIATQASAQACLDAVERIEGRLSGPPEASNTASARSLLEHLIPVFDALDRIAVGARDERVGPLWARRPTRSAEALRVLTAQLQAALASAGIEQIRDVGVPFDEDNHRAVERREEPGLDTPRVRSVIAPGYRIGGRAVREAQVEVAVPVTSRK